MNVTALVVVVLNSKINNDWPSLHMDMGSFLSLDCDWFADLHLGYRDSLIWKTDYLPYICIPHCSQEFFTEILFSFAWMSLYINWFILFLSHMAW